MKISTKLYLVFSIFILIVVTEIALNHIITNNAQETNQVLNTEINPIVTSLEKYKTINTELYLLAVGKLTFKGIASRSISNRIKGITEVELPYLKDKLSLVETNSYTDKSILPRIKNVLKHSNLITKDISTLSRSLMTVEDYKDSAVIANANNLVQKNISYSKDQIEYDLSLIIKSLQKKHDELQAKLVDDLSLISKVIFYTGVSGCIFCIIIAFQVTSSISNPAQRLVNATEKISGGDYNVRIPISKSNDEFGRLSKTFNQMAQSLSLNFEAIKKHNQEIATHEKNIKTVFNSSPNAKILINENGKLTLYNERFLEYFKLKNRNILNFNFEFLLNISEFPEVKEFISNPHLINEIKESKETILSRADQSTFYASIHFRRIKNSDGISLLISIVDISDRKEKEQVILNQITELKKINSDLEQFAYVATHDIKVPLNNIESYLMFLQMDESITAKRSVEAIKWIEKSVKQGSQTVQDLVQVTRERKQTDIKIESVSLLESIAAVSTDLQSLISKTQAIININLEVESIDYNLLKTKSIVQNLLSNALKYRSKDRTPELNISSGIDGEYTYLRVEDNGIGINLEKDREKVFGLFKRANDDESGSGLGLYLTKQNIENANGKITVESTEGVGSTFTVYFKNKPKESEET